ncbi:MAG: hypothetical protein ABR990_04560 [Terracidiphilus sp.]|jgi:hypothetical protein
MMASNASGFAIRPQPIEFSGSLSESFRLFALQWILVFSFVPVLIYINLSQIFLLALCVAALCCYLLRVEADILIALFLILLISVSQGIGIAHSPAEAKNHLTPFLFLTSLLIAPTTMLLARSYPPSLLTRLMPRIIRWVLVFLTIECVTRLIFSPYLPATGGADVTDGFYLYKASLFFFDSNFTGIEILCLLAIMFVFRESIGRKRWLLAYLLLLATFSRASIAAGICQLLVYKLWRWRVWTLFGLLITQIIVIGHLFMSYTTQGSDAVHNVDGSLSSKLFILSLMTEIYRQADAVQRIFGVGVGNLFNLTGIFAHNIVATFVLELGIGGSILFAVYLWILSRKCPASVYLLVLPIVINGFSLVSTTMPYFFVALGLFAALRGTARDGTGTSRNEIASREIQKG